MRNNPKDDAIARGDLVPRKAEYRPIRSILQLCACYAVCLVGSSQAKEKCSTEIKLLLLPTELHSALRSLNAGRGEIGSVYLFDADTLELLSQGVVLRLRTGTTSDLTVKLRPPATLAISDEFGRIDHYKCEFDLTGEGILRSYSIQTKLARPLPRTWDELRELLSPAQKRLLEQAHVFSVDLTQIKRIAEIRSTQWAIKGQSPFPKLAVELWEWRTITILELSTRVSGDAGPSAYAQLRKIAVDKGLSLNRTQRPKTQLALEGMLRIPAP